MSFCFFTLFCFLDFLSFHSNSIRWVWLLAKIAEVFPQHLTDIPVRLDFRVCVVSHHAVLVSLTKGYSGMNSPTNSIVSPTNSIMSLWVVQGKAVKSPLKKASGFTAQTCPWRRLDSLSYLVSPRNDSACWGKFH